MLSRWGFVKSWLRWWKYNLLGSAWNRGLVLKKGVFIDDGVVLNSYLGGEIVVGEKTQLLKGSIIDTYGGRIKIGKKCSLNPYSIIYGHGGVVIGKNVRIASHAVIISANHNFLKKDVPIIEQGETKRGIVIEDDVWLGSHCVVLDGVKIAKGTVVGAGAVVTKATEPYGVYAGVPAKKINSRK